MKTRTVVVSGVALDGGEARMPLGLAVVGGLVILQFITLYLTPVVFVYLDRLQTRLAGGERPVPAVAAGE